jgi:DNA-damage-inducible protein J
MANLNIRVDDTLKKQAESVFSEIGMNLSTATIIFLKQVVRCNGIPFELKGDPFYSAENQSHLSSARKRMEQTGGVIHELLEVTDD